MKYLIFSIILIILSFANLLELPRKGFQIVSEPVQFGVSKGAKNVKSITKFFSGLGQLERQNKDLFTRVNALESQIMDLYLIGEENKLLKQQLNAKSVNSESENLLIVDTRGNPKDPSASTMILSAGSSSGIQAGDNVILNNYIIGVVKEVGPVNSVMELITSPEMTFEVYNLSSEDKSSGLARGQYGSSLKMERILQTEDLEIGDIIATSGSDGRFLPNLYVGKVSDIIENPSSPLKEAELNTVVNLQEINKVFVITGTSVQSVTN